MCRPPRQDLGLERAALRPASRLAPRARPPLAGSCAAARTSDNSPARAGGAALAARARGGGGGGVPTAAAAGSRELTSPDACGHRRGHWRTGEWACAGSMAARQRPLLCPKLASRACRTPFVLAARILLLRDCALGPSARQWAYVDDQLFVLMSHGCSAPRQRERGNAHRRVYLCWGPHACA
eukprot:scaffold3662_cov388-Prasinococcus_capsulatus_cf.AAC.11